MAALDFGMSEVRLLRINGEVRNYGFGFPGRSVPSHVDSDKLQK